MSLQNDIKMNNPDLKTLKELAEKAKENPQDEWVFHFEANPQTILALLDRYEKAVETIKILELNFRNQTKCEDNKCDGCYQDAKIAHEYCENFLKSIEESPL